MDGRGRPKIDAEYTAEKQPRHEGDRDERELKPLPPQQREHLGDDEQEGNQRCEGKGAVPAQAPPVARWAVMICPVDQQGA